ncbi:MAG: glutaminyl-peptide cyclotransferase [Thermoanaerobaculia bacterium]
MVSPHLRSACRRPGRLVLGLFAASLLSASPSCAGETGTGRPPAGAPGDEKATPAAPAPPPGADTKPERLAVRVLETYPHDPEAFTQGLLFHEGVLYESTGRYGRSELRRVDPESGRVLAFRRLPGSFFGEGLARIGDRLVQLTWRSGVALVWDVESFERRGELSYSGEGWGLAGAGDRLVMSDGSSRLTFRDPETFAELGDVRVTLRGRPLEHLNELEVVDGEIWANVWGTDLVVRIDPDSGEATGVADLSELRALLPPEEAQGIDVLNGIAWWPERRAFLLTGKLWPRAFLVDIARAENE